MTAELSRLKQSFIRQCEVMQTVSSPERRKAAKRLKEIPESESKPVRPRVFCASLADWLDEEVPIEWLADLLDLIRITPNLDWLLLTKRPQNWRTRIELACVSSKPMWVHTGRKSWQGYSMDSRLAFAKAWFDGNAPANVWIGTTVEDQTRANERIPHLLRIPARVRFLSCEPLLGAVNLTLPTKTFGKATDTYGIYCNHCCNGDRCDDPSHYDRRSCPFCRSTGRGKIIDWVIAGGESGSSARPMHPDWARGLRDQCQAAGVPFLFKQWGEWAPLLQTVGETMVAKMGKSRAGRLIDGVEHNGFPEVRS